MLSSKRSASLSDLSIFTGANPSAAILHITDSEGSESFFTAINHSKIVKYDTVNGLTFYPSKETPYLIFGGDVTDRGNNDLAITKLLVDFKKRHPENVFLLAGNREIIKCRLKIELAPDKIRARLLHSQQPRWLSQPTVPLDYVKTAMLAQNYHTSVEEYVNSLSIEECQIIYLKWMLEKTMGCPHSFRYRREELAKSQGKKIISDEDVLRSFLQQTMPDGVTGQYLQLAQVGVVIPGTGVLAVHGGLQPTSIGRIPGMQTDEKPLTDARYWIRKFNDCFQNQIRYWINFNSNELTKPACTELDNWILQPPGTPKTVITDWMLNKEREFVEVPLEVSQYLFANNINVVLTGHQPCGDHPAILRSAHNALFINGDTGYAAFNPNKPDDTRGASTHSLEINACFDKATINIRAVLADSRCVTTQLSLAHDTIEGDRYIGKVTADNHLVQCRLPDGDYRLIRQKGFQVEYSTLPESALEKLFATQPTAKAVNG